MAKSRTYQGKPITWVVYKRTLTHQKVQTESLAVCEQSEWDELEAAGPGIHVLVQAGFTVESDAEKAARGTSGDTFRKGSGPRT
jgi:hypothetical protein